jgi:hypothetical protein
MIDRNALLAKIKYNLKYLNSLTPDPDPTPGVVVHYTKTLHELYEEFREEFIKHHKKVLYYDV